jgi:hypothetical protein
MVPNFNLPELDKWHPQQNIAPNSAKHSHWKLENKDSFFFSCFVSMHPHPKIIYGRSFFFFFHCDHVAIYY